MAMDPSAFLSQPILQKWRRREGVKTDLRRSRQTKFVEFGKPRKSFEALEFFDTSSDVNDFLNYQQDGFVDSGGKLD